MGFLSLIGWIIIVSELGSVSEEVQDKNGGFWPEGPPRA